MKVEKAQLSEAFKKEVVTAVNKIIVGHGDPSPLGGLYEGYTVSLKESSEGDLFFSFSGKELGFDVFDYVYVYKK